MLTLCKFEIEQGFLSGGSSDYAFPKKVAFESKVETDLYEFCKNKTSVLNMTVNHTGDKVVMTGGDRKIRIFRILTGGKCCQALCCIKLFTSQGS